MLFRPNHIDLIKQRIKRESRRAWKGKPKVKVGRFYPIMRDYRHKHNPDDGYILIEKLWRQRLGDMSEQEAQAEGGYTLAEYKEVWIDINGSWNSDEVVWVVDFDFKQNKEVN